MKKVITTENAPAAIGPYSQGIATGNLVFASGQLPIDRTTGAMPEDAADQVSVCLDNVEAVLQAAGASLADLVKVSIFLQDISDFDKVNRVYQTRIPQPYPARSAYEVGTLPKGALVEVEVIAVVPD